MEHGDARAVAYGKLPQELRRQGDLRHKDDRTAPGGKAIIDQVEIRDRFAAARHAIEKRRAGRGILQAGRQTVIGCLLLRRPLKGLLPSLVVVFAVSLLAQVVAKIPAVSYYGFESVFFSVLFGLVIRNVWRVPAWMKPAIQGEFFIKIGVVCLGATILFSDVMKSGVFGLVPACLVVAVVWFFAFRFSRRMKVDERSAMILASGLSICGVSASITAARVVGGDDRKLSYIVSLVLIVVVPMIYLMPWLANLILPHLFAPEVAEEVAGAWIGGTIDTTSGVAASSMIVGEVANQHAVIIKAEQNVLIGVVAFFIALYLSTRGEKGGQAPSLGIVWEKFPKFILGFVAA